MPKTLRSNFPYGSYLWAVRAAQWRALGGVGRGGPFPPPG